MNAVIDKPKAKATKRAPAAQKIDTPLVTIADIREWIGTAEAKLEMACDAAERGEPIDTLLDHINHNVLSGPFSIIHREDLTQGDAKRIYTGLFPVLACLQGAIKLAEGTILPTTLEEAFALLDAAQTALDPVNQAVRMLPEGGPAYEFERGRDLAIQFINEGSALSGERDCYRGHRDPGTAQKDFASDYLLQAVDAPEMLGGFAAVLSQVIGNGEGFNGEFFSKLTLAETQAGEIQGVYESSAAGANGKKLVTAAHAPDSIRRAAHSDDVQDPYVVILNALACVQVANLSGGTDVLCALYSLTKKASEKVSQASGMHQAGSYSLELHDAASDELAGLLGLLRVLDDGTEPMLSAAETLVILCKAGIDRAIHEQPKAGVSL
ncbi:hypothetical protein VLK31_28360 [Variovorax sp. H27-G14]|uniref:hypothetical protein n=1 Tax=Variovorax sp. H27-G14 TaxID=3111914 RepID=UPI0038FC58C7